LKRDLTKLIQQLPGVETVTVESRKTYADNVYRQQKFELPSKVLFVDDERDFVQTVSQRLISRDVGTYGVYNGKQALELIAEDQPEVMVLDLKMPGLHGVEVLRKTKELAPEIEVIILTGHGTTKDMDQCMELGAFAYMNKPVNIEELSATIKAANDKVHSQKIQTANPGKREMGRGGF
jgi:DNA-binding NtrC family response regulator